MADYAIHDTTLIGISNVIRKKEGSSALIDPAEYAERINLMGMLEEKSASSASVCSFSDGADDVPMSSVVAHIAPTLTGVNAVNMKQTGKNFIDFPNNLTTGTSGGITFSKASNGGISYSGTATGTFAYITPKIDFKIPSGKQFTLSRDTALNFRHYVQLTFSDDTTASVVIDVNNTSVTYTLAKEVIAVRLIMSQLTAQTAYSGTVYIQIEYSSSATDFEVYTATQYTANLGKTVYGADADIVKGEGTDYGDLYADLSDLTWDYSSSGQGRFRTTYFRNLISIPSVGTDLADIACSAYTAITANALYNGATGIAVNTNGDIWVHDDSFSGDVSAFVSSLQGVKFAYKKATPTAFIFDGQEIPSLLGVNNLWHDAGETEAVYRSSGTVTPVPIQPVLVSKTITENGEYSAEDDDADGYDVVTVNVAGGDVPFVPQFTETKIADNTAHASSFTLTEDYANYDMVKIVWYESASSSGFLYTTPDILDEIFSIGVGKLCVNKPSTNYYICYSKSGLTWTQTNQRNIFVHEVYGVTFTNCTMTATDLYKRGASTTDKHAITSQTSLKDYDLFMMASIHATDGSETMPTTWLYQYPKENMSEAFSCPVPAVLQEYNANDEAFVISEYGMTSARYFMVQGITFTPTPSLLSMSPAPTPSEPDPEDPEEVEEEET